MNLFRIAVLAAAICCSTSLQATSYAQSGGSPRQYYSSWQKHPQHNYHYRKYYYKPTPKYVGYKHHYVIHHPSRPKHTYFYNPYKKVYWGRCDAAGNGEPRYSLLAEEHRKSSLANIAETAFPAPDALPPMPDSSDGILLDLPPDDLPGDADAVAEK